MVLRFGISGRVEVQDRRAAVDGGWGGYVCGRFAAAGDAACRHLKLVCKRALLQLVRDRDQSTSFSAGTKGNQVTVLDATGKRVGAGMQVIERLRMWSLQVAIDSAGVSGPELWVPVRVREARAGVTSVGSDPQSWQHARAKVCGASEFSLSQMPPSAAPLPAPSASLSLDADHSAQTLASLKPAPTSLTDLETPKTSPVSITAAVGDNCFILFFFLQKGLCFLHCPSYIFFLFILC